MGCILVWVAVMVVVGAVASEAPVAQGLKQSAPAESEATPWITLPEVEPLDVEGNLVAAGSSAVAPLVRALYTRFIQEGYRGVMQIDSTGDGAGFRRFCERSETDIAMASRYITPPEGEACIAHGRTPVPFHLGTDALAIVVHRDNDFVHNVTRDELRTMFTAERWSDVNPAWPQRPIRRLVPGMASGTFEFFVRQVFEGNPAALQQAPNTTFVNDDNMMAQEMSRHVDAISVLGFAYYRQYETTLRLLAVDDKAPTAEAVAAREYALIRPLLLYADPVTMRAKPQVRAFINFALRHAPDAVERVGDFPTSDRLLNDSKIAFLQGVGYAQERGPMSPSPQASTATGLSSRIVLGNPSHGVFQSLTHVLKAILERRFGLESRIVQAETDTIFAEMDRGDGRIDVCTGIAVPNRADLWEAYIAPGSRASVLVNQVPFQGSQGLFVPGYLQDKYGVTSVEDLLSPEIAQLFDRDGNGKGEYWPGEQGSNAMHVELVKARSYGYDRYFEPLLVDQAVFEAWLKARYQQKQGVLFYSWKPNPIHAIYDLRRLAEPAFNGYAQVSQTTGASDRAEGCWRMLSPEEDANWFQQSRVTCAWPETKVYVAFAKSLTERAPKVAQFLRQVAFDAAVVSHWMYQIREEQRDPDDVARVWLQQHPDIVNQWLAGTGLETHP
jgi:glycine betaine/proline transport system substrate-binding protein